MAEGVRHSADNRRWWRSFGTVGIVIVFLFPLVLMAVGWSMRGLPGLPVPQLRPGKLPEAHWEAKAALGMPRDDFGVATVDGRIWVFGGATGAQSGRLDSVEIYEPASNSWSAGPKMTSGRSALQAVAIDKTIYLFGGAAGQAAGLDTAEALDTTTGQWRALPPLPAPRSGHAAVALNGLIYVIGGLGDGKATDSVQAFDPAAGTWRAVAPLPTPRYNLSAVVLDGKIVALGGSRGDAATDVMEVFDPATGKWTAGPAMLAPMANFGATVLGGRIYALYQGSNQVFDPRSGKWIAATEMPTSRQGQGVASVGAALYAIGGSGAGSQGDVGVVESYILGEEEEPDNFQAVGYNPAGAAALILGLLTTGTLMATMLLIARRRPRPGGDYADDILSDETSDDAASRR